jgi:sigma-54-interacting transcriptional regulator
MELRSKDVFAMIAGMASSAPSRTSSFSNVPIEASTAAFRYATLAQHSVLLEGPDVSIEVMLSFLMRYLREPVTWNPPGTRLRLPADNCGALVLQNVSELNRKDQDRLLAWLNDPAHQTQIISTTIDPLFPKVCAKEFDDTLYYRLSVVRCPLDQT